MPSSSKVRTPSCLTLDSESLTITWELGKWNRNSWGYLTFYDSTRSPSRPSIKNSVQSRFETPNRDRAPSMLRLFVGLDNNQSSIESILVRDD